MQDEQLNTIFAVIKKYAHFEVTYRVFHGRSIDVKDVAVSLEDSALKNEFLAAMKKAMDGS